MENKSDFMEFLDTRKSAMVMWDIQNILVEKIYNKHEFLDNARSLAAAARIAGIPVFFTRITPLPEKFESPARKFFMRRRPRGLNFTAEGFNLSIDPQEGDTILHKNTASIFIGTNFELVMRNAGLSTVIFSGIATELGIESSARDALNRGFFPVIITDGVSSSNKEAHERSLQNLVNMMLLMSTKELIDCWKV